MSIVAVTGRAARGSVASRGARHRQDPDGAVSGGGVRAVRGHAHRLLCAQRRGLLGWVTASPFGSLNP